MIHDSQGSKNLYKIAYELEILRFYELQIYTIFWIGIRVTYKLCNFDAIIAYFILYVYAFCSNILVS